MQLFPTKKKKKKQQIIFTKAKYKINWIYQNKNSVFNSEVKFFRENIQMKKRKNISMSIIFPYLN